MQQIADWLEKLGMPEYAQRFAENGIDVSVLRYLTDQDLEKIGALSAPRCNRREKILALRKVGRDHHPRGSAKRLLSSVLACSCSR